MVYFLVLVVFVKVLVVFSEIGVVLVVFGSGGSETLNPTLLVTSVKCVSKSSNKHRGIVFPGPALDRK